MRGCANIVMNASREAIGGLVIYILVMLRARDVSGCDMSLLRAGWTLESHLAFICVYSDVVEPQSRWWSRRAARGFVEREGERDGERER